MGLISHHAVGVTGWPYQDVVAARQFAVKLFRKVQSRHLVTPVMTTVNNGYYSFFVAPDGVKEFRELSDLGDQLRSQLVDYLEEMRKEGSCLDWFEVKFGGDHREDAKLVRANTN